MEQLLGLPPDGSAHGHEIDSLIVVIHWLMVFLFVGWGSFYTYTLIRFRKSRNPQANYAGVKSHLSSYLEIGVAVFEAVLLIGFSIPLWSKRVDAFPAEKDAVVVHVVAEQFAWNIHYPGADGKFGKRSITLVDADNPLGLDRTDPDAKDDITTINQLNLPVNTPAILYISSKDVIHGFNLPTYRVKQDAIPGQNIPLWFTPTKTTDEIREEERHTFSIAEVMKKVRRVALPQTSKVSVAKGANMNDLMAVQDVMDASGVLVISKGDRLTEENTTKLADAGIHEVMTRPMVALDKYMSAEELKDNNGNVLIGKDQPLMDEAITSMAMAGIKEISARPNSNMDVFVLMESYTDKSGAPLAVKGDAMSEELITKFAEAGIHEVVIAPATPTEIACAQLCGLGHYRMRGYITVQTQDQYKQWFDGEENSLREQYAPPQTTDSAATSQVPTETPH